MTLADFLKNIADGIREKEKSAKPIAAAQYASRLKALQTVNDEFDAVLMIHARADDGNIYGIESYKSLTIVEGAVGSKAFTGYDALENVTIGNGVTAIEEQAFYNCRNLTKVTIGNGVERIGNSAFENCQSLVNITYIGTMAEWEAIEKGGYWNISTGEYMIHCIDGEIGKITVEDTEASRGLELTLNDDGISYSVTGIGTCTDTDIIIPRFYNNKFVTEIGENAFSLCKTVTSITIPNSVTSIGENAFIVCFELTSIIIPDSVKSIGDGAFYDCTKLASVYITDIKAWCDISFGDSVANPCNYGADLYLNGEKIINLVIPNTVNTIKDYAFRGYESLETVTIPDSVKSISTNAFSWCDSLTSITVDENNPVYHSMGNCLIETASKTLILGCVTSIIPDDESITSIGEEAFGGCVSLTSINIPNSVTKIGDSAFYSCTSLMSISIPDSVMSIGDGAFYNCYSLNYNEYNNGKYLGNSNNPYVVLCKVIDNGASSFEMHKDTKIIGERSLANCVLLTDINIGDSVTSIESFAFSWNDLLTNVTFKGTPKFIRENAFNYCYNLLTINVPWSEGTVEGAPWGAYNATINYNYKPSEGLEYTLNNDGESYSVSGIGTCADTDMTIPSTYEDKPVTEISDGAFQDCSSLTSVVIPDSITSIGGGAFYNCTSLTSVTIPNSVTSIGEWAFFKCTSLADPVIPDSVTSINEWAFGYCEEFKDITIPESVTNISSKAFNYCSSLKNVTFEGTPTSILTDAFNNCYALTTINVPWAEGEVANAPWGATKATINYNHTEE